MDYRPLGRSNLKVSAIALGTMTWGEQNTQDEAFAQIEYAKNAGINFLDTAEMYPVPPKADTYATTERYIGNWFKTRGDRADWVLASKIAGPGNGIDYIRDGQHHHHPYLQRTPANLELRAWKRATRSGFWAWAAWATWASSSPRPWALK